MIGRVDSLALVPLRDDNGAMGISEHGTIEQTTDRTVFRSERRFARSIDSVWHAITADSAIDEWMGTRPEIDLRPGGKYVTHHWDDSRIVDRILRLETPRLFEHTYFEDINPGAIVTWRLAPTNDDGCLLTFTHVMTTADVDSAMKGVAAGDDPITILSRNALGWHILLDQLQKQQGEPVPQRSSEELQETLQHYVELLGPETDPVAD